ncbi:MAG: hypothetical protein MK078_16915 [Crocinitomicaceae bacterium]|nr:hypothetical protein [Crocinitomicaceae bacterium]
MRYFTDDKNYEFWIFGDDLVYTNYFDECEIDELIIHELMDKLFAANSKQPYYSLVSFKNIYGKFSQEAKEIVGNHPDLVKTKKAEVLLSNSLAVRLLIKGYLLITRPSVPTFTCETEKEGLEWLISKGVSQDSVSEFLEWRKSNS